MRDTTIKNVKETTTTTTVRINNSSKSIWSLVFYTLSVIVVCLTGFNFYLFCWIWSSLSTSSSSVGGGGSLVRSSQWAPIDTTSSWDQIKFNGKLTSLQELQVDQILAALEEEEGKISISSKNSVQITNNNKRKLIELLAKERRIQLPSGLKVAASENGKTDRRMRLVCDPKTAQCLVDAPRIQLSNRRGINFARKSLETPKLITRRLHSPTNWLNLFSAHSGLLESTQGSIQLSALDELSLFSHNSAVILNANTIDVSQIRGLNDSQAKGSQGRRRKSQDGKYKLCICLPIEPKSGDRWNVGDNLNSQADLNGNNRVGLVFAVKPHLSCAKFSSSFCNKPNQVN